MDMVLELMRLKLLDPVRMYSNGLKKVGYKTFYFGHTTQILLRNLPTLK